MDRCIVASGSFVMGLTFNGPFPNPRAALAWADRELDSGRILWTVAKLEEPSGDAGPDGNTVLVVGDAINGHNVVGPFASPEASLAWFADNNEHAEYAHPAHLSPAE